MNVLRDHVLDISREALGEPHYVNVLRAYRVDIPDVIAPRAALGLLRAPWDYINLALPYYSYRPSFAGD